MSEELVIDFSNIPLKPLGKSEIQRLEMALIIGTLYRPEVLELIRDPTERATWMDSLAIAAAAFARYKAGMSVSQIAEELGRSEATIRNHLSEKTKAGKLVSETYEKLRRSELKLVIPFIKAPVAPPSEEVKVLREEVEKLKESKKVLEEKLKQVQQELEVKTKEVETLQSKLNELVSQVKDVKDLALRIVDTVDKLLK
ncbi:MAG: helix-turn-helix domain-containing protein [Sulfolobales archaeon]